MNIRLSLGSAVQLGLREARMAAPPTTIYTMLGEACLGGCRFCTQARTSGADRKYLSRIVWPEFNLDDVLARIAAAQNVGRVCIQTLMYADLLPDLVALARQIAATTRFPLSVCMNPTQKSWLVELKQAGVERVGVGLDCATQETFEAMKPGFSWARYMRFVDDIVEVFGTGAVHLIVGLGDTDQAIITRLQQLRDANCYAALFAYTPVRGVRVDLPPPAVERYRALQLARYLITNRRATLADMRFREGKLASIDVSPSILEEALGAGTAFRTSGCPSCNRPLYNERPGGVMYNYPQPPTAEEKAAARDELRRYLEL